MLILNINFISKIFTGDPNEQTATSDNFHWK